MHCVYHRADLAQMYLPTAEMLQIDRVLEITNDTILCDIDLTRHWVFPSHLPGDPIFPASLMIEAAGQAIAIWAWHHDIAGHPRLARVRAAFTTAVRSTDRTLNIRATIRRRKNICQGTVQLTAQNRPAAQIQETLAWV